MERTKYPKFIEIKDIIFNILHLYFRIHLLEHLADQILKYGSSILVDGYVYERFIAFIIYNE